VLDPRDLSPAVRNRAAGDAKPYMTETHSLALAHEDLT
jgi:hypothetical protein